MATKTSDWRPGPTVCRCCLAEGCYKDISTEYFWMGKREVYAEMLSDTLNVTIAYSKSGGPNSNSRLICEPCISRLRDASDFKRQVLECEKTFMQHLDPASSSVQNEIELIKEVKVERVKQESKNSEEDDDFEDRVDFMVDNDDTDDDLDDEPLMKLATKVPKKEVDLLDLLDNSQVTVKRKATASKVKEPTAKKAKKREIVIKPSASKASASAAPKVEKKKKEIRLPCSTRANVSIEMLNAKIMVQFSTVYPFKLPSSAMVCIYCDEEFDEPPLFRQHMKDSHESKSNLTSALYSRLVKVDCTEINCRICSKPFENVQSVAKHLKNTHQLGLQLDRRLGLVPFFLPNSQYKCSLCTSKSATLRLLSKHMSMVHFPGVTCEQCGKSFANPRTLQLHDDMSHKKIQKCVKCKRIFSTSEERNRHYKASPSCWSSVCSKCNLRFMNHNLKEKHLQEVHSTNSKRTTCAECGETFPNAKKCLTHFRLAHTDSKLTCSFCPAEFVSKVKFDDHVRSHTKERPFACHVCGKAFCKQFTLKQHMWQHTEEKRFKCKYCDKQFIQKSSWVTHMKNCHPVLEFSDG